MDKHVSKHEPTYSKVVAARTYNRMMTNEHIYIASADRILTRIVRRYAERSTRPLEVVDIGCGPARVTVLLARVPNVHVTAVDHDPGSIADARQIIRERQLPGEQLPINLACANIETYQHPKPIDIAVSQGSHHHIEKGLPTQRYLENIRRQLAPGGTFTISDEMIPYYSTVTERYANLCVWYSHVISDALRHKYGELATAEIQTLLDDLFEGSGTRAVKGKPQTNLIRSNVHKIARLASRDKIKAAHEIAFDLVAGIWETQKHSRKKRRPLSRGDYKICFSVFQKEVHQAGFRIREARTIGPVETIGGFGIYTLEAA